jgi:hypothetical protein
MVLKIVLWSVVVALGLMYITRRSQNKRHKAQR